MRHLIEERIGAKSALTPMFPWLTALVVFKDTMWIPFRKLTTTNPGVNGNNSIDNNFYLQFTMQKLEEACQRRGIMCISTLERYPNALNRRASRGCWKPLPRS